MKQFRTMKSKEWLLCLCATLLLSACSGAGSKGQRANSSKGYATMTVSRQSQTVKSDYTARLQGREIVEIRPQVSGTITQILVKEGQRVSQGQTLFIIDQVPFEAALHSASANVKSCEARLATAKMNFESSRLLQTNSVVSDFEVQTRQNELHEAEAALAQAQAQLTNARKQLSYTVVKSPVSGSAGMIPYHVGALVSSTIATPLVTVTDDHEVLAYFAITDNQSIDIISQYGSMEQFIKLSPEVELTLSNGKPYALQGRIDAMSGIVDQQTGAVTIRARFDNPDRLLHNGGTARIVLPTMMDSAIVIPQTATYELQNRVFVYRVIDGKAKSTPVSVYRQNDGNNYIVQSGLKPGDVIIKEGAGLIKEGTEVK